ncbi:MocR-like pyridoxine biosynthesis transcription factor PdxR [Vibrio sp. MMH1-50]|uniref:MocR-like pyridoxine biosynthesis transcription factor PdxR n=1 Tax=Vibrio sp. MMH1-50 TaxID=2917764 RepID=UPI001EF3649F|nr:PLP-dependent aminotransferase family protein [Vibrio sp. MMH1-50]MCG7514033.1 PLP-dependent aminotransferase family protein [Vibrio sp. MMH1-50]
MDGSSLSLIDIGDLYLKHSDGTRQQALFFAIREKIVQGLWAKNGKLPSTRKLSQGLNISRNTVIAAYEQLVAEGYLISQKGSGFYVAVELPEQYLPEPNSEKKGLSPKSNFDINRAFAPGVPDLDAFPMAQWQKLLARHMSRTCLLGNQDIQGSWALRCALANYLASSRSVSCSPERIIITSGAQQALSIATMVTLKPGSKVLMEQPGYAQMRKLIQFQQYQFEPLYIREQLGFDVEAVTASNADALYVTPSNQYPMGTTLNTEQRGKIINWAVQLSRWIIEDDYDSEFQFAHRPYTSLQGLAAQMGRDDRVLYVGSFSKVMFNGLRLGYLVVPDALVEECLVIKDALSGDSPSHTQEALADFITEGGLLRHIRKMRRLYKTKHEQLCMAIEKHFGDKVKVISQAAGLHITLKWQQGIDENEWTQRAKIRGIVLRPMSFYEHPEYKVRDWQGVVLGYGNVALGEIDALVEQISELFE